MLLAEQILYSENILLCALLFENVCPDHWIFTSLKSESVGITKMDETINRLNLFKLADQCSLELVKRRRKEPADDSYCLEIFRRAIVERDEEAWTVLQGCFSETIRIWIRSHTHSKMALLRDSEENYVAQAFSRFWVSVHKQRTEFGTLNAALSYLKATLNGIFGDLMRAHLRSQEVPFPEQDSPEEPAAEQSGDELDEIWNTILGLLKDDRERRVMQLRYYYGLKPRYIVKLFPQEFSSEKEICRICSNIIERLRRNSDLMRWLLSR